MDKDATFRMYSMTKVWITLWLAPIILVLDEGSCLKVNDVPNILYNAFRERDRCRKHLEPRVQIRVCAHTHTHTCTDTYPEC